MKTTLGAFLLTASLLSQAFSQEPRKTPSDEAVLAAIRAIQQRYHALFPDRRAAQQQRRTIVREALSGLDLSQLTGPQASMLAIYLQSHVDRDQVEQYRRSLERLAKQETVYGAIALVEQIMIGVEDKAELLDAFFAHAAMPLAMNTRHLNTAILRILSGSETAWMKAHAADVARAVLAIEPAGTVEPMSRATVARLLGVLDDPAIAEDVRSHRRAIHGHLLRVARATLAGCAPGFFDFAREGHRLDEAADVVAFLEGPAGRAELVGHEAPELEFTWVRGPDAPMNRLSDLRGKVVVLDFWATWCTPCVASFPDMARLQAHYADSDVVIVGITSIQGYHVPGDGRDPIELEGRPEREMELMAEFAEEHDVTWNLAFSSRTVIDPRYDVFGIPHMAIVDTAGIVRHNKLHPSMPHAEKVALIDALLTEAGLDVPR